MSDEEAHAMLTALAKHYGEPVRRVSAYCEALETWARLAVEQNIITAEAFQSVRLGITKSCLLARLIYGGEQLRERPCPKHKGRWSGIEWHDPKDGSGNVCPYGCGLTGWLPNSAPTTTSGEGGRP